MNPAYLAGIVDGMGKFVFVEGKPHFYILSKDKEFLQYLQNSTGLGRVFPKNKIFIWLIQSREEIHQLIDLVEPYVVRMKGEIELFRRGLLQNQIAQDLLHTRII